MTAPRDKPTIPEVADLVWALYYKHSAGHCWHVVLSDGNVSQEFAESGARQAKWCDVPECKALADVLPRMSSTQRRRLGSLKHMTPTSQAALRDLWDGKPTPTPGAEP